MKMSTMNISLTPEQSEYVRRTVEREFGNASEYFRELIRERMAREIEADLALEKSPSPAVGASPANSRAACCNSNTPRQFQEKELQMILSQLGWALPEQAPPRITQQRELFS
jgi:Arc/MetJ-type ribon-helix-helix transcriptional regulator